ncbi:hydroxymethylglutaryl-CoA synthase, partial [Streptococcus sp. SPC0]|nr:hydroxymethylglutaryl-CoA synthase [Streptococcus sp. SPC0]
MRNKTLKVKAFFHIFSFFMVKWNLAKMTFIQKGLPMKIGIDKIGFATSQYVLEMTD